MRKRTTLLIACGLAAVVVTVYLRIRITPELLRTRIDKQVPVGSSSAKVLAFLDSIGVDHSDLEPNAAGAIRGAIKGFRKGDLLSDGVFLEFKFDASGRLLGYRVEYSYTFF